MSRIEPAHLLESLKWRYATKLFDSTRVIAPEIWRGLEEALVLTPSSYGLQPWRFIVITDSALKQRLRSHSWNQAQVTDCSHYVVFATVKSICEADIDRFIALTARWRNVPADSLAGYRSMMVRDVVHGPRGETSHEWAARQVHIALGNFMTAAALLRVDTCPMEGFIPQEYDKILELGKRGLTSTVCCAAGYRHASDKYAGLAKVRFPHEEMIERI